jgi:hypothetical protein
MPLPSSGPLTLANIQTEFGGANPISLNEYYAGGAYVPAGTSGTYGAVPSSGTISIRNFYGTTAVTINLGSYDVYDFTGGGRIAYAGYQLTYAGAENEIVGASTNSLGTWCTPSGQAVNYEVYVTVTGSPLTIGFINAWTALSTTQTWRLDAGFGQNNFSTLSVTVRRVGTTTPTYTATINLNADASF